MEKKFFEKTYEGTVASHSKLNGVVKNVEFEVIPSKESLKEEGQELSHSVFCYLGRISNNDYLAVRVKDIDSKERATLGLTNTKNGFVFDQLKGYQNCRVSLDLVNATINFCKKNKINLHQDLLINR
jgi:hypothetical protein